jgi:hypothetical protein
MRKRQQGESVHPLLKQGGVPVIEAAFPGEKIVYRTMRRERAENNAEEGKERAETLGEAI